LVPSSEDQLTAAACAGSLAAFNQLVELHQQGVFNVCLRMLGSTTAAEDATQETFFAAYRSVKGFKGGSFRAWMLRIAANQCYDQMRGRQRHPTDWLDEDAPFADPDPQPDAVVLSAEVVKTLEAAILKLPPEQRLCVLLVDVQGLDYDEASRAMEVSLGTVKSRLSRARARLRELLPEDLRLKSGG